MRVWICVLLIATVSGFTHAAGTDWVTIVKPVGKQVPRLELKKGGEKGVCSGVVINREAAYLLTAAHCTGMMKDREGYSITVNGRHAELARANEILDLAIVKFDAKDEQAMPLAEETPPAGSEVAVIGFLLGSPHLHLQFGHIAARRAEDGAVVMDAVILPGDSGGAIIDSAGRLIAMTNRYYQGTAVGLAVPIESVRDFVKPYLPKP